MDLNDHIQQKLDQIRKNGNYRTFQVFSDRARHSPYFLHHDGTQNDKKIKVLNWCSNDYLGLGGNLEVHEAMFDAITRHGSGAGGTRNISGNHLLHVTLENALASWHQKDAGLLFSSGYVANVTAISTLAKLLQPCIIYSD
ncbi:MAG: aminotransferase class I/II-fold pyridoxal phosphate-dependent enzyme, partial [Pseudomonadota bacterium]